MTTAPRLPIALRRRPPPETLRWAERALGRGWRVSSARRLRGGTSSAVHVLRAVRAAGEARAVVLRRFTRCDVVAEQPDIAEREARILEVLAGAKVPAPRLIAVDPGGTECDVPAVLMTRLEGRIDLAPADLGRALRAMVAPLSPLHALGVREGVPSYFPYYVQDEERPLPPRSRRPELWRTAYRLVEQPWPEARPTLIHRDYHPGNLLWRRGTLTGVTDWVNTSNGPPGIDVAHCRINLVGLFGLKAAEEFRRLYEAEAGVEQHPFWDLLDALDTIGPAPGWQDAGRHDLTAAIIVQRDEEYLESVVRRLC